MKNRWSTSRIAAVVVLLVWLVALRGAPAQTPTFDQKIAEVEKKVLDLKQEIQRLRAESTIPATSSRTMRASDADLARIRDEGLNRSQVMQTLSYLTDVIGPRLTGSPGLKRANDWSRDKLASWGLANAHLEAWGPFGRGWSLKHFSVKVIEPQTIPLIGYPKAWSPGFDEPLVADVVHVDAKTEADLEKYQGKLKGAIVLAGALRPVKANVEPLFARMSDEDLRRLANLRGGGGAAASRPLGECAAAVAQPPPPTSEPTPDSAPHRAAERADRGDRPQAVFARRLLSFLIKEEAAVIVSPSAQGDGGTLFVAGASIPRVEGRSDAGPRAWSTNAPAIPAQIVLATEDYNRLVRMIGQGEKLKMSVDLQVQFHDEDLRAYNTIAEIAGGDLKDEIVMLGAHLDSWHSGTGATDNGAGVAVVMEAVRILQAAGLKPRRTIRIGLWTGEEQGLFGSKAYVREHFGHYPEEDRQRNRPSGDADAAKADPRTLVRAPEYDRFSAYFNLDNGAGKIRGIYLQENTAVLPIFREWLAPLRDLDADTISMANTGGTDHLSFHAIGLPGFQFIQDPLEYMSRTHHSSADVYDRIQPDDLKQASVIMAGFVYNAAMADEKLPRKTESGRP